MSVGTEHKHSLSIVLCCFVLLNFISLIFVIFPKFQDFSRKKTEKGTLLITRKSDVANHNKYVNKKMPPYVNF